MSYRLIRKKFLDYFTNHGHKFVPSSSVVPDFHDNSCLFVNAGMFQFKNILLGQPHDFGSLKLAANSQKCIRISGKHNDLEEVGRDNYHHTFFEMLGNWSFDGIGNEEACHMALDLLVNHYSLPLSKLYFTYFGGGNGLMPDRKTRDVWISLGVDPGQIIKGHIVESILSDAKTDNFWSMGNTGPCGPCTEIYYDGSGYMDKRRGALVPDCLDHLEEIWNIVSISHNMVTEKNLSKLPVCHIDTGMGFERLVKIVEGKKSNYETSLFQPIREHLEESGRPALSMSGSSGVDLQAFQTVLDHVRCLTVAVTDGATFTPGGRGPPLKQLMKRSIWFAERILEMKQLDWSKIVPIIATVYDDIFPEITANQERTIETLNKEMYKAQSGLYKGEEKLVEEIKKGKASISSIHDLYQTHGFPLEVSRLTCKLNDVELDWADVSRIQSYTSPKQENPKQTPRLQPNLENIYPEIVSEMHKAGCSSVQLARKVVEVKDVKIACAIQKGNISSDLKKGPASLVLDKTCLYPLKPGCASEQGFLIGAGFKFNILKVELLKDVIVHSGIVEEEISDFSEVPFVISVDVERRLGLSRAFTSMLAVAHCVAKEAAIKNNQLRIKSYKVGLDRAIVQFDNEQLKKSNIKPENWAEIARSSSLVVDLLVSMARTASPWTKCEEDVDVICFDGQTSPYHEVVEYPMRSFVLPNLRFDSTLDENVSESPKALLCAPVASNLHSARMLQVINCRVSKDSTKVWIACGKIGLEIENSVQNISNNMSNVYEINNNKERVEALRKLTEGKILPYRFRYLLRKKKIATGLDVGSDYFGLFKEPECFE